MKALHVECPGLPASTAGATAVVIMLLAIIAFAAALRWSGHRHLQSVGSEKDGYVVHGNRQRM